MPTIHATLSNRCWFDENDFPTRGVKAYTYKKVIHVQNPETYQWHDETEEIPILGYREGYIGAPRGDLEKVRQLFGEKTRIVFDDQRSLYPLPVPLELSEAVKQDARWEEQSRLLEEWCAAGGGVIKSPAASGKSVIGVAAICMTGLNTLLLFDRRDFLAQWQGELYRHTNIRQLEKEYGAPIVGLLQRPDEVYPITLSTFDKLHADRYKKEFFRRWRDYFGLVIGDEIHHSAAATRRRALLSLNPVCYLGVTATPFRKDKLEGIYFDIMGPIVTISEGEQLPFDVYMHTTRVRVSSRSRLPDFAQWGWYLKQLITNEHRNRMIVKNILADYRAKRCILVISERNEHVLHLKRLLCENVDPRHIAVAIGSTKNREQIYADVESGKYQILIAGKVLDEGVNIKRLDALHLATPFANKTAAEQRPGRIRRPLPGKPAPHVHDYADEGPGMIQGSLKSRINVYKRLGAKILDPNTKRPWDPQTARMLSV